MSDWYYEKEGEEKGAVDFDDLKSMAKEGIIGRDTPVWKSGMPDWKDAGEVEGIFETPPPVDTTSTKTDPETSGQNENSVGIGVPGCLVHLGLLSFFLWIMYQVGQYRAGRYTGLTDSTSLVSSGTQAWSWIATIGALGTIASFFYFSFRGKSKNIHKNRGGKNMNSGEVEDDKQKGFLSSHSFDKNDICKKCGVSRAYAKNSEYSCP